jgi:hypothetical protein
MHYQACSFHFLVITRPTSKRFVRHCSSAICKAAALGFGWDKAFGAISELGDIDQTNAAWVDVDQKGQVVPAWKGFDTSWPKRGTSH